MTLREYLERIQSDAIAALALLPPPSTTTIVRAGENLQAALDKGGSLELEAGATFTGTYIFKTNGTTLVGAQSAIKGTTVGPAIVVPPGVSDVQINVGTVTTDYPNVCVLVGAGDSTQTALSAVPRRISLIGMTIPQYRGKRGFEINGAEVVVSQCHARDVWDPAGRDSQGLLIWNTPGPVRVSGGTYEAGSENILVGGDPTAIANVVPTGLTFEDLNITRPLSWRTDGIKRKVKNNFELKSGINVILRRSKLSGCWVEGQDGWLFMITPRNGKTVQNVLIEDCQCSDAGGFLNMLGHDDVAYSPQVRDMIIRRTSATTNIGENWGSGRYMQWQGGPGNILVEDSSFDGPGNLFYVNPGKAWPAPPPAPPEVTTITRGVVVQRNRLALRTYGIMLNGYAYGRNWQQAWPDGVIAKNTFFGDPAVVNAHKATLPADNTFQ